MARIGVYGIRRLFHVKDSGQGLLVDLTSRFLGGKHDWSTLWIHY